MLGSLLPLAALGVAAAGEAARDRRTADPPEVVIDEGIGMLLALALGPSGVTAALLTFGAFRVFDIVKPYPVRHLERLPGGWGIVADDVAAALYAAAAVRLIWAALS
jgi:phosphatidylglycerophosphatase A